VHFTEVVEHTMPNKNKRWLCCATINPFINRLNSVQKEHPEDRKRVDVTVCVFASEPKQNQRKKRQNKNPFVLFSHPPTFERKTKNKIVKGTIRRDLSQSG
jgi:hypothetical protein